METPLNILILDDSVDDAKLMQRALSSAGIKFDAVQVQTRDEFLAALAHASFDLLLADYRIPGFGGGEAIRLARERFPELPTILVTGTLPDDAAVELLREGAVDYVLKDRLSRLAAAVRRAAKDAAVRAEVRAAEQTLRQSEERFRTLAEAAPVGIFRADADGGYVYVNPCWEEMSGLAAASAIGEGWLRALHADDRAGQARGWKEAVAQGTASAAEYRFLRPDGTVVWAFARTVTERDAAGRVCGFLGTATDITALKDAEARLGWQLDELRRFQQVTVDRELRMREIQEEIRRLKQDVEKSDA